MPSFTLMNVMIYKENKLMHNNHSKVMKLQQQQTSLNYLSFILAEDGSFKICMYLGL